MQHVQRRFKPRRWRFAIIVDMLSTVVRRAGIVILLAWLAVEVHELGHFLVYTLAGYRARMSFQRVSPLEPVPAVLDHWAKLAGPVVSIVAAVALLHLARRRHGFALVTAAVTNASIRLLPLGFDLSRALHSGHPFSDEGEVALAVTSSVAGRTAIILPLLIGVLALTALAVREYRFRRWAALKIAGVFALCLIPWIGVVLLDDLLGLNH